MISPVLVTGGCQLIGGFAGHEVVEKGTGGQGGGSGTGGGTGGGVEGQGGGLDCSLAEAPDVPTGADSGDQVAFVLAASGVELGEDLDVPLGLDIDKSCTCNGNEACPCAAVATCARPGVVSSDDAWKRCDAPGGVDRNSTQLFNIVNAFDPILNSQFISAGIELGGGSALFDVREYNGLVDDDKVFVGVYTTGPFLTAECNDAPPQWEGEDAWPIDKSSVFNELSTCGGVPFPTVYDPNAYVVGGELVARLDEVTLAIQFGTQVLRLTVHDVTAVVPLQQGPDGRWFTTGATLAGRWDLADVFRGLGELNNVTPIELCDPMMLGSTQSNVCAFVDAATHDRPGDPCDAVSFALAFDAQEARIGNTVDLPPSNACPALLTLDCETAL